MPAITVQDVVNEAPALLTAYAATAEGAAYITSRVTIAEGMVDAETFGDLYRYALALMAAHLTLLGNSSLGGLVAGSGVVQSESVGSVSVTYATSQSVRAVGRHGTTAPGSVYDELLAGLSVGFIYFP